MFTQAAPVHSEGGPEQYGLIVVAPLSDRNAGRVEHIADQVGRRLSTELWTPHTDVTIGRVLPTDLNNYSPAQLRH